MGEKGDVEAGETGHVESVRKEFAVREDGVLAYHLQEREIEDFYCENVRRNRNMREDVKIARQLEKEDKSLAAVSRESEQKDREMAQAVRVEFMRQASAEEDQHMQRDMIYARQLERQESQSAEDQLKDEELAQQLQLKEEQKLKKRKQRPKQKQEGERILNEMQAMELQTERNSNPATGLPIGVGAFVELPPIASEVDVNDSRLAQEVQDSELAQAMNGQEEIDRKMAIEQQDEELAYHLQQKEKDKARKRQQKLLQQREEMMRLQQEHQLQQQQQQLQQQQSLNAHPSQQLQQASRILEVDSHATQHQRNNQRQPASSQTDCSPNITRQQSLPGNQTQPHRAGGRSPSTSSAPSATAMPSSAAEHKDSPTLFTYNSTLSGQKKEMAGSMQPLAKRNYKRGSSKKK